MEDKERVIFDGLEWQQEVWNGAMPRRQVSTKKNAIEHCLSLLERPNMLARIMETKSSSVALPATVDPQDL